MTTKHSLGALTRQITYNVLKVNIYIYRIFGEILLFTLSKLTWAQQFNIYGTIMNFRPSR